MKKKHEVEVATRIFPVHRLPCQFIRKKMIFMNASKIMEGKGNILHKNSDIRIFYIAERNAECTMTRVFLANFYYSCYSTVHSVESHSFGLLVILGH